MPLPKFPVRLISRTTSAEFLAHDMGSLNELVTAGGYLLAEPTPGVHLAVYTPPAREERWPVGYHPPRRRELATDAPETSRRARLAAQVEDAAVPDPTPNVAPSPRRPRRTTPKG